MTNKQTRKRLLFLIEKYLDCNQPLLKKIYYKIKGLPIPSMQEDELFELIDIIINYNPYIDNLSYASLNFSDSESFEDTMVSSYSSNLDRIDFYSNFIYKMLRGNFLFSDLVETGLHEQRHHEQDLSIRRVKNSTPFQKRILDHFNKDSLMTPVQHSLIARYINNIDISNVFLNPSKIKNLEKRYNSELKGAYFSAEHEIDAFITSFESTQDFMNSLLLDPLISDSLKTKLEVDFKKLLRDHEYWNGDIITT